MRNRHQRIAELNAREPLNRLALECLDGIEPDESDYLALLQLTKLWWHEGVRPNILRQYGSPSEEEIESVLTFLNRAEPDQAMRFLTELGDKPALSLNKLRELDGDAIAGEVITLLAYKLALGVALPTPDGP